VRDRWNRWDPAERWTLVSILIAFSLANVGIFLAGGLSDDDRLITVAAWGIPALVLVASMSLLVWRTRDRAETSREPADRPESH
jgi:hypothetical protein